MRSAARTSAAARRNGSADAPTGPRTVAVVHESSSIVGGAPTVSVAVGPISADGTQPRSGGRPPAYRKFAPDQIGALRGYLKDAGVDLVIRTVPTAQTICRLAQVPDSASSLDPKSLADALSLMAETDLPAQLPWHRRASGLVTIGGLPRGMLVGWHNSPTGSPAAPSSARLTEALAGLPQLYTPEAVGLAAILESARSNMAEPPSTGWALSASPGDRSATLVAFGPSGSTVRILLTPADDPAAWRSDLTDAVLESLELIGGDQASGEAERLLRGLQADKPALVSSLPGDPILGGEPRDRGWVSDFGIVGATLEVFADPGASVRGLFNLHAVEPRERANPILRLVQYLASPARAAVVIIACVVAILGARLGVAYARHRAVTRQVANTPDLAARLAEAEQQVAFASVLRSRRWPMTKLLADVAAATPVGIELETLEIVHGDKVSIRGTAQKSDLISQFRENLAKTKVFESIGNASSNSSQGVVQFNFQAVTTDRGAMYESPPIDDFAANPLGKRIHGPDWKPDRSATALNRTFSPPPSRSMRGPDRGRSASSANEASRPGASSSSPSPSRAPASVEAEQANKTPPLTDAEFAKLTKVQAMLEWTKRKKLAGLATDKAVAERLRIESDKCKARMDELKAVEERGDK